ncbi:MAG: arsenical pump-driving ATPase [Eubacterium sp.]|nr:arsenical pump-driving ATPase [Eubacterium sp.]MDY5497785.1 arsenical pump-driving ATPase [Anaerobutyricum sp.]
MYPKFRPETVELTKYLFYTGKGGVGKTSTACATAVYLADHGKKVFLISTDPASNLQDVFEKELDNKGTSIEEVPNLMVANLNPEEAAAEYRESVVGPYRGKLPESVVANMEEQLSGSCTVEIASFNEFSHFITDDEINQKYDYIIFDTAPTGHTLRMLQLPSAWDNFIEKSTHGASCLGQLAGLGDKKEMYAKAVKTLSDGTMTTLILVSRPEPAPLIEAARASAELSDIGVNNQKLIINGILERVNPDDKIAKSFFDRQHKAVENMPESLKNMPVFTVPLRSYNVSGIEYIRRMLYDDVTPEAGLFSQKMDFPKLDVLIDELNHKGKKVIFTMGKGGVGKTTVAIEIAKGLAQKGKRVHLTTTDPAGHMKKTGLENYDIEISNIDEKEELKKYQDEVIAKSIAGGISEEDLDYIKEDLRSPCTQEIAVFRAFAEIVEKAEERVVVIDTAPTGHTLLLLNSTESYAREMKHSNADIPDSVKKLLPRLRNQMETEVVIVTLPEATPYYEAYRLEEDLNRAEISNKWWVINASLKAAETKDPFLRARAEEEMKWIGKIANNTNGNYVVVPWKES